jgi:predicted HTH domain antitoxin
MTLEKSATGSHKNRLTIDYSDEILWTLQQDPEEFAADARLLLAIKLYETGKLSTGLAAQLAGVSRNTFYVLLSQNELSSFGETPEELEEDLASARAASRSE